MTTVDIEMSPTHVRPLTYDLFFTASSVYIFKRQKTFDKIDMCVFVCKYKLNKCYKTFVNKNTAYFLSTEITSKYLNSSADKVK